jgi:predicted nuclease of predicted toxin-antitoxin system
MKIVVDESVSYGVVIALREAGYNVIAISEPSSSGITDEDIFMMAVESSAILISRDYHFTSAIRFPPDRKE